LKEWVKGSHIILERNPDYWDKLRHKHVAIAIAACRLRLDRRASLERQPPISRLAPRPPPVANAYSSTLVHIQALAVSSKDHNHDKNYAISGETIIITKRGDERRGQPRSAAKGARLPRSVE
jgi:hypothetical protein